MGTYSERKYPTSILCCGCKTRPLARLELELAQNFTEYFGDAMEPDSQAHPSFWLILFEWFFGGLMNLIFCMLGSLFLATLPVVSLAEPYGLPPGAQVIELQPLQSLRHPQRALILWMLYPKKVPRDNPDEPYACPEYTRGSYYQGPTRVSLVDTRANTIINTVKIITEYQDGQGSFDIPYRIQAGMYYHVNGVPKGKEGKPTIMWLKDYNGDGHAWEFAFFDAIACMGLPTTLIGYRETQDRVLQYPVELTKVSEGRTTSATVMWVDYLFSKPPQRPGFWQYAIDYRGRGGSLDKYEIRYLPKAEKFQARLVSTTHEP